MYLILQSLLKSESATNLMVVLLQNLKKHYFVVHLWTTTFTFITILTSKISFESGVQVQLSLTEGKKFGDNLQLECVYESTPNATIIVWSFNSKLLSVLNGTKVTDFEQNISGNNLPQF